MSETGDNGNNGNGNGEQRREPMIPRERFDKIVESRNALQSDLDRMRSEIAELTATASTAQTLARQLEETRAQLEETKRLRAEDSSFAAAGITDARAMRVFRLEYSELGENAPKLGDWLKSLTADGAEPPPHLAVYLSKPGNAANGAQDARGAAQTAGPNAAQGNAANGAQDARGAAQGLPRANNGAQPPPVGQGDLTADQIRSLSDIEFKRRYWRASK